MMLRTPDRLLIVLMILAVALSTTPARAEPGEPLLSTDNILGWIALALVVAGGAIGAWWVKVKDRFRGGGKGGGTGDAS